MRVGGGRGLGSQYLRIWATFPSRPAERGAPPVGHEGGTNGPRKVVLATNATESRPPTQKEEARGVDAVWREARRGRAPPHLLPEHVSRLPRR